MNTRLLLGQAKSYLMMARSCDNLEVRTRYIKKAKELVEKYKVFEEQNKTREFNMNSFIGMSSMRKGF